MNEQIPFFSEDPTLNLKVVTCYDGTKEYRRHCKSIKDEFYVKNKHCFFIDGVWYRINSGLIAFNHSTKEWFILKAMTLSTINGIVGYDEVNKQPIMGYFDNDPYNSVKVLYKGTQYLCIDEKTALLFAREAPAKGFYVATNEFTVMDLRIKNYNNNQNHTYNCDDDPNIFYNAVKLYENFNFKIPQNVHEYARYLGDITFGTEIECIRGGLPQHIMNRTGTILCRDGSLKDSDETQGPEYTTVPYKGAKGVESLIYLATELSKRNEINNNCSLHIHIGGIPTTRTFIIALYKLCMQVQDDLFKMFPFYKTDEVKYAGKNKNYCQKLHNVGINNMLVLNKDNYDNFIQDSYIRIYRFLLEGSYPSNKFNRKNKRHPRAQKWERHSRYYWANFINLVTSARNTVEFRLHTATTNPQKIVTWLFICNAIVKTALCRTNYILKNKPINIYDVFNIYSEFYKTKSAQNLSEYLTTYYNTRCEYFRKDFVAGDFLSMKDLDSDRKFRLECKPFTDIFNHS